MTDDWHRVARALWETWDPIGMRAMGGPSDEYDAYADAILRLLREGADEAAVARHLLNIATDRMGLTDTEADARTAARSLLSLGIGQDRPS